MRHGNLVRSTQWAGVQAGDVVIVDGAKERRQHWVFVAHVLNEATGEEWIDVRGGRAGEAKGRSFHPESIYPAGAKRGSRLAGLSLAAAPQFPLSYAGPVGGAAKPV
jgi:hypothetical protein